VRMIPDKRNPSSHELGCASEIQRDKSLSNDSQKGKEGWCPNLTGDHDSRSEGLLLGN